MPWAFIVPAAASLIGGKMASDSTKKAADQQTAAANRAAELQRESAQESLALQRRMYEEDVARQQPYYDVGVNALGQLTGRTGAMPASFQYEGQQPAAFQFRPDQLTTDPGYGFRLQEGLKALERSAAARGGLLSGGAGKALTRYGQEMASQEFGNAFNRGLTEYEAARQREAGEYSRALTGYESARQREAEQYNRLAGLASVGSQTASGLGAAGRAYGSTAGNITTGLGTNLANLAMGQGTLAAQAGMARGSIYNRSMGDIAYQAGRYFAPQQNNYLAPVEDRSIYPGYP